ncbi:hypothetical protein L1049_020393 [Liquidambar formosana]|uniref:Late embryogenesis abundant protein LEA-2 subgroup domain-containing protein n=1 Tax=Liquidambar formosana TaxID=63359 RepID=A0AAP0S9S8_LIQFO
MAEKIPPQFYPLEPSRSDVETPMEQSKEFRRKKRIKCLAYVAAFVVFQTIVILIFSLTVMRVRTPKFRLRSVTIEDLTVGSSNSPSFNMRFNAQVTVKNMNFGSFKFDNSTITFAYGGASVGEAAIMKGKARFLSTKKMNVAANAALENPPSNSNLGSDINAGMVTLSSHSRLSGKVNLMMVFKKKKSVDLNCTMTVNLANKDVQDINCD